MLQSLEKLLLGFFGNDASVIAQINAYQGNLYIDEGVLIFSLADLFDYLSGLSSEKISYKEFQRQLYQSTLNQDLKAHGAQVVVHHSTGKVETNLYRLERLPRVDSSL